MISNNKSIIETAKPIDLRRIYPITLIWGHLNENYRVPIFYDHKINLATPFIDYCIFLARGKVAVETKPQAYKSFIEPLANAISDYLEFLHIKNTDWKDASDALLIEYRNWSLNQIINNIRSRSKLTASRSVNEKLIKIYEFYRWAQSHALLIEEVIGWSGERVKSSLGRDQNNKIKLSKQERYPLCFTSVGEGSRQRASKFLTEKQLDKVVNELLKNRSHYLRKRNLLLFRIAESVGLRRESIASLNTDQFHKSAIDFAIESDTKFLVVPSIQKFGYQNAFSFPIPLALAISRYCDDERKEHLSKLQVNEDTANKALFPSETTGKPINKKTITHVLGSVIKKVAPSKGMGPHALRDTYATMRMSREISFRKRNQLSLSPDDLGLMLAGELGHKSISSQAPYTSAMRLVGDMDIEQTQSRKIIELKMENDRMKLELARLKEK
jgi:site-specific recombinase XerD